MIAGLAQTVAARHRARGRSYDRRDGGEHDKFSHVYSPRRVQRHTFVSMNDVLRVDVNQRTARGVGPTFIASLYITSSRRIPR